MSSKVDIIVPVYNEEKGIDTFYERVRKVEKNANLYFIDNASKDKTVQKIKNFDDVILIRHDKNEGYGGSISDGIKQSFCDIVLIIDADCEYPPECIPELIKKLENADVVYASRFYDKRNLDKMPILKKIGNKIISGAFNFLFKQNVTDLYTGCKAFKRSALCGIALKRKGFESVLEMGVKFARKKIRICEIPVEFQSRRFGTSQMKHISETIKYFCLLIFYFSGGDKK